MNVFSNEENLDTEIEDADFTVSMPSYVKNSNSAISKEDINIASPFKANAKTEIEDETVEETKPFVSQIDETIEDTLQANDDKTIEESFTKNILKQDNTIGDIDFLNDIDNLDETVFSQEPEQETLTDEEFMKKQ
ncbi:hypothetical protein FQA39_LY13004 [Lamprigera yunnana]|nr:hypothetical protein FQA39_LY13004 [Lamprigera yunnana]